jgi:uncharacterized membrane protein
MPERTAPVDILLAGFGIVYPAIVFFLRGSLDPLLFIVLALAIVGLRLAWGDFGAGAWRPALACVAVGLIAVALVDATLAARAYPVLLSLAAAFVFAVTLWRPPSLVERLALASGAVWSPGLQVYCRTVTVIWTLWLCLNGAIAAGLALVADDRAWALWTGLVSYLVSGALFAGEWLMRRRVVSR